MLYRVIPTQFAVAYQDRNGNWVAVSEGCSAAVAQEQAERLNAAAAAKQAEASKPSQRFVPPAQRRPVRSFPNDAFA